MYCERQRQVAARAPGEVEIGLYATVTSCRATPRTTGTTAHSRNAGRVVSPSGTTSRTPSRCAPTRAVPRRRDRTSPAAARSTVAADDPVRSDSTRQRARGDQRSGASRHARSTEAPSRQSRTTGCSSALTLPPTARAAESRATGGGRPASRAAATSSMTSAADGADADAERGLDLDLDDVRGRRCTGRFAPARRSRRRPRSPASPRPPGQTTTAVPRSTAAATVTPVTAAPPSDGSADGSTTGRLPRAGARGRRRCARPVSGRAPPAGGRR